MALLSTLTQCLLAATLLPLATAKPYRGLAPRSYPNGTHNATAIAPKVFLIDMVRSPHTHLTPLAKHHRSSLPKVRYGMEYQSSTCLRRISRFPGSRHFSPTCIALPTMMFVRSSLEKAVCSTYDFNLAALLTRVQRSMLQALSLL